MSGQLPIGYVDFSLLSTRPGDPNPYVVTWACEIDTPPFTQANLLTYGAALDELLDDFFPNDANIGPLRARVGTDGEPIVLETGVLGTGAATGEFLPQNCAFLMQKRSALGGRRNRGRIYWPIISEGNVNEVGEIASGFLSTLNTFANNFLALASNPTHNLSAMVILHSTGDPTPTTVTDLDVPSLIATQRRRLRR